MTRKNIPLPNIAEPADASVGSQCIVAGNQIFISGQIAYDNGKLVGAGDALEQCRQCFRNIQDYVAAAGGTMDDVVSLNIFLNDISYRQAAIDARAEVFTAPGPSATVVGGVDFAFEDLLVEISAIAILP
ncbi:MAG: 2-iminobutanoate/2-iminopropanoate deaminase [Saprospiraceae bacterium]|jgi:2-iminobutanoate/2-iminopropanoate deaminase